MKKNQKQICGKLDQDQQGSTMIDQNWRIIIGRYISWGGVAKGINKFFSSRCTK